MDECGCVIVHLNERVSVKLCSAHSYGTEMLPVLRRFVEIFHELEARHGQRFIAEYTDTLHEARALLRRIDGGKTEEGRVTDEPTAEKQNVRDSAERHTVDTHRPRRLTDKLA
jgi:hypothetical protein